MRVPGTHDERLQSIKPKPLARGLKHPEADREIFLGIFTDRLHQVPCFNQHLISIVVERWVLEQLARAAFTRFQPV
jgi:hypothetical protein